MMVKIKEIKEENEDDEYVKSSNKSSTPLLLPRLANGRTSLCLLLWCWCFLVIIAFFFFFNLTRTLAKFAFQGAHKATTTNVSIREMLLFFPLSGSFLWVLVSLDSMTKKKKKINTRAFTLQARTTFPTLYARAKHRWSSRE